jgi:hypothetical protein
MSDKERPVKPELKWETDLSAPFIWLEWKMEWIVYGLSKLAIFKILEYAAKLTILFALILYVLEIPQRKRQAELNAWQIINSAMNQKAASGRVEALEYLNNAGVDLSFLDVQGAYLVRHTIKSDDTRSTRGINLPNARLREANFKESTLSKANLGNAYLGFSNLEGANLFRANLREAKLWGANLEGAKLWDANFREAVLLKANLRGAKNLTYEQLCKAKSLYSVKLDSGLQEKVKKECPELLVEPVRVKEFNDSTKRK